MRLYSFLFFVLGIASFAFYAIYAGPPQVQDGISNWLEANLGITGDQASTLAEWSVIVSLGALIAMLGTALNQRDRLRKAYRLLMETLEAIDGAEKRLKSATTSTATACTTPYPAASKAVIQLEQSIVALEEDIPKREADAAATLERVKSHYQDLLKRCETLGKMTASIQKQSALAGQLMQEIEERTDELSRCNIDDLLRYEKGFAGLFETVNLLETFEPRMTELLKAARQLKERAERMKDNDGKNPAKLLSKVNELFEETENITDDLQFDEGGEWLEDSLENAVDKHKNIAKTVQEQEEILPKAAALKQEVQSLKGRVTLLAGDEGPKALINSAWEDINVLETDLEGIEEDDNGTSFGYSLELFEEKTSELRGKVQSLESVLERFRRVIPRLRPIRQPERIKAAHCSKPPAHL